MCGIFALFTPNHPLDETLLYKGVQSLHHRGPDHQGIWLSKDRKVGLSHARLSINDLHTGFQPMSDSMGRLHCVVNGEFYDFVRIRQTLKKQGCAFKTQSDSEILLHLYAQYGCAALEQLRGEFAFVLWHEDNQTLFAGRDRLGIKPLYFGQHQDQLFLASEVKALFAAGFPALWDVEAYVTKSYLLHHRTLYKGIQQVPPGHYLLATPQGGLQCYPYWDLHYPKHNPKHPTTSQKGPRRNAHSGYSLEDFEGTFTTRKSNTSHLALTKMLSEQEEQHHILEIRKALQEAIALRLQADVPVGVYLSGGLDSCALLGMAAPLHQGPLDAFTLSFDEELYDESAIAQEMAQHAGAHFHKIPVTSQQLADHFSQTLWHNESVIFNAHCIAKFILSQAVHQAGYKAVLTGEGADEIFAGYPGFRQDLLETLSGQEALQLTAQLTQNNSISTGLLLPRQKGRGLGQASQILGCTPSWLLIQKASFIRQKRWYTKELLESYGSSSPLVQWLNRLPISESVLGRHPVHKSMYLWSKSMLPNYILSALGDRMEMAHSLEGRLPYLDHHLVEQIAELPLSLKIKGVTEKYILREAARPFITDTVYAREKHPFLAPPATTTPGYALATLVQDTLRSATSETLPFFRVDKIKTFLDELPRLSEEKRRSLDPLLMEVTSLCILQKHFGLSVA